MWMCPFESVPTALQPEIEMYLCVGCCLPFLPTSDLVLLKALGCSLNTEVDHCCFSAYVFQAFIYTFECLIAGGISARPRADQNENDSHQHALVSEN